MLKLADKGEPENGHGVASSCNVRLHADDVNRFGARSTSSRNTDTVGRHLVSDVAKLAQYLIWSKIVAQKLRR